jgi:CBS domain containing-hemolysin-like protein
MDVLLIVVLTLLNGVFAMSEMALASSRKALLLATAARSRRCACSITRRSSFPPCRWESRRPAS